MNLLRQHAASKTFDVQVFDGNKPVLIHQHSRPLVLVVEPLIEDVLMYFPQENDSLAPTVRTFLATCYSTLSTPKFLLCLLVETRILNALLFKVTLFEGSKVFQIQVNAYHFGGLRQRVRRRFDRKADVPVLVLTAYSYSLNLAVQRAVQLSLDVADPLYEQMTTWQQLVSISVRRKRDAVIATTSRAAKKSTLLPTLNAPQSTKQCLAQPPQNN